MKKLVLVGIPVFMLIAVAYRVNAEVKALWLFDEGQGTKAMDSSGNGCDGEINGAKYVQGKYGTGLKFDGKSFVNIGFPKALQEDIVGPFTVETWIKIDKAPPADHSTIIVMQTDGTLTIGFTSTTGGGFYGYAGDNIKLTDPDVFPVGEWVHVAQTFDGEIQKLYRNGEEIASQNAANANFDHPLDMPWTIGAWSTHSQYFLQDATVDEMRISDEALEPEELGFFERFSPVKPLGKLPERWGKVKCDDVL
jgi:hypothetical protein